MASALTETVLQYIPTFEKVEPYNNNTQTQTQHTHDGAGTDNILQHSLVLTQPDNMSTSSTSSHKTDKMQKKLDYEAGKIKPKSSRRILRGLSKSILRASSKDAKERPPLKRSISRTISNHEINLESSMKKSIALKRDSINNQSPIMTGINLKSSVNIRASNELRRSVNIRNANAPVRRNSVKPEIRDPVMRTASSDLKFARSPNARSPAMSLRNSVLLTREASNPAISARSPAMSPRVPVASSRSPAMSPRSPTPNLRGPVNSLRSSAALRTRSSNNLRNSAAVPADSNPLQDSLGPMRSSMEMLKTPVEPKSPKLSSGLKRSNGLRRSIPVGGNFEALNVLLHDFEAQKRRVTQMTELQNQIYEQELAKYQQMMEKKKMENDTAIALAKNIKDHETRLICLYRDLEVKQKNCQASEEEVAAVAKEFEAELHLQDNNTSGVTTAALRMQEASNRKELREQWKRTAAGPVADSKHRLMLAQEELRQTQASINVTRKELGRLKNQASKERSSDHRLREEVVLRDNMRQTGQPRERGQYVRPKGTPKNNEKPAAMSRLEEEKAKRLARKRATVNVSDLIAKQAGVHKGRYGCSSPYRNGLSAGNTKGVEQQ